MMGGQGSGKIFESTLSFTILGVSGTVKSELTGKK
ncbi:hypothetical protein [Coxiella burnetii]|nr:hypothetical protein [Coxiella burnetii]ATN82126.1 hypothetical protein AYO24_05370 [Coxiella burnetii]ATN84027.1 hypothetical protein AYO23_05385 [Coxiella burnetii]POZ79170.1 hypothetical protein CbuRSA461_05535 [Coxiella burnetii]